MEFEPIISAGFEPRIQIGLNPFEPARSNRTCGLIINKLLSILISMMMVYLKVTERESVNRDSRALVCLLRHQRHQFQIG